MVVFSLTLVRHGETSANKDGIIQGHQDVALSDEGLEQARLVAVRLKNEHFTHIFASDLSRAAQTAQAIAEASSACRCAVQLDKRLRERTFGEFEGKTFKELFAAAQKSNKKWPAFTPPGAETCDQVRFRAEAFFLELCEMMAKAGSSVDGPYIPSSIKDRHNSSSGNIAGLSNGTVCRKGMEQPIQNTVPTGVTKTGSGASTATKRACLDSSSIGEDGMASSHPCTKETHLPTVSVGTCSENMAAAEKERVLSGQVVGETAGGATITTTTMARSNSSSSSGCSSLHDSMECTEGDVDGESPPTPSDHHHHNQHHHGGTPSVCVDTKQLGTAVVDRTSSNSSPGQPPPPATGESKWHLEGTLSWFRDIDWSPVFGSSSPSSGPPQQSPPLPPPNACPNVSLSPMMEHRLTSLSSVSSGRNSSFDDADMVPLVAGDVLVVTHGGLIKELVSHFIEDYSCKIPGGKGHALRVCPNTGVSCFMVTLHEDNMQPTITCLRIHCKDHLKGHMEPLAEPTPAV